MVKYSWQGARVQKREEHHSSWKNSEEGEGLQENGLPGRSLADCKHGCQPLSVRAVYSRQAGGEGSLTPERKLQPVTADKSPLGAGLTKGDCETRTDCGGARNESCPGLQARQDGGPPGQGSKRDT